MIPAQPLVPSPASTAALLTAAHAACARIAPLWPLKHFVAVNPFLGFSGQSFLETADLFRRLAPGGMQMPLSYYAEKVSIGEITEADLEAALAEARAELGDAWDEAAAAWDVPRLRAALHQPPVTEGDEILTVAEAVDRAHGTAWECAVTEAISTFCAAYFDEGQSAWRLPWRGLPLFAAWRAAASLDAGPESIGLRGFRARVAALPEAAEAALVQSWAVLGQPVESAPELLHKALFSIRGWAGAVQYRAREAALRGGRDQSLSHLLAIRLAYDAALLARYDGAALREFWPPIEPAEPAENHAVLAAYLCQLAEEHAWQRSLFGKLRPAPRALLAAEERPAAQAVFCIDVRSERLRRGMESVSRSTQTLGFAGFFGMPIEAIPFGQRRGGARCPVLLTPKYQVPERMSDGQGEAAALRSQRVGKRVAFSWSSFRSSAVSCFSFVEAAGLAIGAKLFHDAFAPGVPSAPAHQGTLSLEGIPAADRVALALGALRGMGLTRNFARLVLLCGHGSQTANNPCGSGLDCGACGGHAGDANSRVAAAILNDPAVRTALSAEGIHIPGATHFLAGLHNTTTDDVTLFDLGTLPPTHGADLAALQEVLAAGGKAARRGRAASLGLDASSPALDDQVAQRTRDWAQVRPEWGLAGNAAFVAAPRARSLGADLGGRVFLHDYDPAADTGDRILEMILTAPVVVASWINLQYFGSTVNNAVFGSGNKTTHNVVGLTGVCQGNGGDLQTGLPLQSVHDGRRWMHAPVRLHVIIEAPRERIDAILARHASVRQLFENGWLRLFALEAEGARIVRRDPGGRWHEAQAGSPT